MSDTCIVCLGHLESGSDALSVTGTPSSSSPHTVESSRRAASHDSDGTSKELIAHLVPCGHNLHDECLKPWVERANSCPICRQNFNLVELCSTVGGSIMSSYKVEDRVQVAELDPAMIYEEDESDELIGGCTICGGEDDEDRLLICDGCMASSHTYCVGLDHVPAGHWFCEDCESLRRSNLLVRPNPPAHRHPVRRTRGQQRRSREVDVANHGDWALVWQQVWDRLNLDLDFPYEYSNESDMVDYRAYGQPRRQRQDTGFRSRELGRRRAEIAERQGAPAFRQTVAVLQCPEPEPPSTESQEEIRAWNAFEKAKAIEDSASKRKRKASSASASPSDRDVPSEPVRKLKRPRTRRAQDLAESSSDANADASNKRKPSGVDISHQPTISRPSTNRSRGESPTFLQSLLKEVETSTSTNNDTDFPGKFRLAPTDNISPRTALSPESSPPASNHATPRALSITPPPQSRPRPQSPMPLTSQLEPIFPDPKYSPSVSGSRSSRPRHGEGRRARPLDLSSPSTSPPRSTEASPNRSNMSLTAKSDIQRMVRAALSPYWHGQGISKENYASINKNVSRMLYDKIVDLAVLDDKEKEKWEKFAQEEVDKAVKALGPAPSIKTESSALVIKRETPVTTVNMEDSTPTIKMESSALVIKRETPVTTVKMEDSTPTIKMESSARPIKTEETGPYIKTEVLSSAA